MKSFGKINFGNLFLRKMSIENRKEIPLTGLYQSNQWIFPLFFFILNFILRFLRLTENPLSGDEPFSLYHAQMSPGMIISELTKGNNPPLFELMLHYWISLKDVSIGWIRLFPLFFSALTAPFLFLLAKDVKRGFFPFLVVLIYTFSSYHLQYAQEVRVYSLFGCLAVISMWLFLKIWRDQESLSSWIAFTAVNILMIYAHYFGFILLLIQTILVISTVENRLKNLKKYTVYVLIMLVLYAPLIPVLLRQFIFSGGKSKTWLASPDSAEALYNMLWKFSNKPVVTVIGIAILLAAVIKFLISRNKKLSVEIKLFLTWFIISFFGMFFISFKIPMFLDRYLIYGSFSYILLLAYSLQYLFPKKLFFITSGSILVALFGITFSLVVPVRRDAPLIAETVRKAQLNGYAIVICPQVYAPNFTYYYNQAYFKLVKENPLYSEMLRRLRKENIYLVYNHIEIEQLKRDKWLYIDVAASLIVPENQILEKLQSNHTLKIQENLDEITKAYYFE